MGAEDSVEDIMDFRDDSQADTVDSIDESRLELTNIDET